ncbi:MAG: T9SS type A sorting domain-containing protein [Nitrosopumilus sp.]|nr:T9SS type A sorting domain-containing protein [Nitrosopumilus sp.]
MNSIRFTIAIVMIICIKTYAQDSLNILFVGNSLTTYNDLPKIFQNFSSAKGDFIYYEQITSGGATIRDHSNTGNVSGILSKRKFDYTILQEQSQIPLIPWWRNWSLMSASKRIYDVSIKPFCSKLAFYQTIGYKDGGKQCDPLNIYCSSDIKDYNEYQDTVNTAYQQVADSLKALLFPIGYAAKILRKNYPNIDLWASDGRHPGPYGTYLAVNIMYAGLFKKSPKNTLFYASLDSNYCKIIQELADSIVFADTTKWNFGRQETEKKVKETTFTNTKIATDGGSFSICPHEKCKTLRAPSGYRKYLWSTGDTVRSILACDTGTYFVSAICPGNCNIPVKDTITIQYGITPPQPKIISSKTTINDTVWLCANDSTILKSNTNDGVDIWDYSYYDSIIVKKPGIYTTYNISSEGCLSPLSDSLIVLKKKLYKPNIYFSQTKDSVYTDSTTLGFYSWSTSCFKDSLILSNSIPINSNCNSNISVRLYDKGCFSLFSETLNEKIITSLLTHFNSQTILYQNNSIITINTPINGNFIITNLTGQIKKRGRLASGKNSIDLLSFKSGLYIFHTDTFSKKIIIR